MRPLELSLQALADSEEISRWTEAHFGASAAVRYAALIAQAMIDLRQDASRLGISPLPEFGDQAFFYRLAFSRRNVPRSIGRVKDPRHLVLFRILADGSIEVGRILHESMELSSNLPDGFVDE
jgi:toxin ParE1/3/4